MLCFWCLCCPCTCMPVFVIGIWCIKISHLLSFKCWKNPYISDVLPHSVSFRWRDFKRSMFWLAVIYGSLMLLHTLLFSILWLRKKNTEKNRSYGALIFPRFEIFLLILALPCICEASAALLKGNSGSFFIFPFI